MAEVLDDYEQGERVRQWLQQNGPSIAVGLALAAAALFGYNYWNTYQQQQNIAAAANYALLDEQLAELEQNAATPGDTDEEGAESTDTAEQAVQQAYQTLQDDYGDNLYAALSALLLADRDVENVDLDAAITKYEQIIANGKPAIADIARLRLARTQVAANQADAALTTLSSISAPAHYQALIARTRGDALLAKGDRPAALQAYTEAENELGGTPDQLLGYRLAQLRDLDVNELVDNLPDAPAPSFNPPVSRTTSTSSDSTVISSPVTIETADEAEASDGTEDSTGEE